MKSSFWFIGKTHFKAYLPFCQPQKFGLDEVEAFMVNTTLKYETDGNKFFVFPAQLWSRAYWLGSVSQLPSKALDQIRHQGGFFDWLLNDRAQRGSLATINPPKPQVHRGAEEDDWRAARPTFRQLAD